MIELDSNKIDCVSVIVRNIKILLTQRGWGYSDLVSKANLSPAYPQLMRNPEKFNPTIKILEKIARTFNITVTELINPNMDIEGIDTLPQGYQHIDVILSKPQVLEVRRLEEINKGKIKKIKELEYQNRRKLRLF
ncbi:MAG: helix-turn-helix domain-containing protein [Bacilli bacterium]